MLHHSAISTYNLELENAIMENSGQNPNFPDNKDNLRKVIVIGFPGLSMKFNVI